MCDYVTNEHVVTYDPSYVDEHSDSTDFDDDWSMTLRKSHKRRKPVIKKTIPEKELSLTQLKEVYRKRDQSNMPKKTTVNCSTSFCHHCGSTVGKYPESPTSRLDRNCPNAPRASKVNLLKNKLSSLFFRGNRKMPPVEENETVRCKVYCTDCQRRQMRKFSRKHGFPLSPVFLVNNIPTGPLSIPPETPNSYRKPRESISYTTSLSSNSEQLLWKEKLNKHRDDDFEKEFKSYLQYRREKEKQVKSRSQQYSKHDKIDKYQVFTNHNQYSQAENSSPRRDSATGFSNGLPVTASGFWEFFMNKLHARYQEAKSLTSSIGCCPPHCGNVVQASDLKRNEGQNTECQTQPQPSSFDRSSQRSKFNFSSASSQSRPDKTYTLLSSKKSSTTLDVGCNCNPDQIDQTQRVKKLSPKSTQVLPSNSKSCQEPHDEITKALKEKYNGEVLCIHNPPCVLINGCLNVPQQLPKTPVSVWPTFTLASREKKPSYLSCRKYKKTKIKKSEQACQYHPPYSELQQYHALQQYDTVVKTEKLMQSICNHNPPCQVVPGCFRPKYDPQLVNSCVHVPMCKKIPECVENQDKITCDHKPRCFEVPECRRNWTIGRGSMHRQSTFRTRAICRHQPPCLMVPRCLGQVISDSMVPFEAIPGCMHQPPCEVIPACCRKTSAKDALSRIRPPFNKGVNIKIFRIPMCQNKLMKMVGIK